VVRPIGPDDPHSRAALRVREIAREPDTVRRARRERSTAIFGLMVGFQNWTAVTLRNAMNGLSL